jgi:hypothetical protein
MGQGMKTPRTLFAAIVPILFVAASCGGPSRETTSAATRGRADTDAMPSTESRFCAVVEASTLECHRGGSTSTRNVFSCEDGATTCDVPSPYNVAHDDIMCVDQYRYGQVTLPGTCADYQRYFDGLVDCLVPAHCSGSDEHVGDWRCEALDCVCPEGGDCPVPSPPPPGS